jgi:inner membrane protein
MTWWAWLLFGFVLLAGELLTPGGFYLIFFGLAALLLGGLDAAGFELAAGTQWTLFTALSIVATLFFRKPLLAKLQARMPTGRIDDLGDETATTIEAIAPGGIGKAELRGSTWSARNGSGEALAVGQRCRVVKIDGLLLTLEPERIP